MKPQFDSKWDFYFSNIDDKIGTIRVDLGLIDIAPLTKYNTVICVQVKMNNPREDGLSSSEESEKLFEIEDVMIKELEKKAPIIMAGTETTDDVRRFYFYTSPNESFDKLIEETVARYPDYEFEIAGWEEDDWSTFFTFLYPSPEDFQLMGNRQILENLEEKGDDLSVPRKVQHWIYFDSKEDRDSYLNEVVKDNFVKEDEGESEANEEVRYSLRISRTEEISFDNIDNVVIALFRLAEEHNGEYDGWETEIITAKPDDNPDS